MNNDVVSSSFPFIRSFVLSFILSPALALASGPVWDGVRMGSTTAESGVCCWVFVDALPWLTEVSSVFV